MAGELLRDGTLNATRPTQVGGYANCDNVGGGVMRMLPWVAEAANRLLAMMGPRQWSALLAASSALFLFWWTFIMKFEVRAARTGARMSLRWQRILSALAILWCLGFAGAFLFIDQQLPRRATWGVPWSD